MAIKATIQTIYPIYGGKMFELDGNKFYNDDCLNVLKTFESNSIDLTVTSPPYNCGLKGDNTSGKYVKKSNSETNPHKYNGFDDCLQPDEYLETHSKILKEILRVSKMVCYNFQLLSGNKDTFFQIMNNFRDYIIDVIIWNKTTSQPAMGTQILNAKFEFILLMENEIKLGRQLKYSTFERGTLDNVWNIPINKEPISGHSALMPLDLALKLIKNFSKEKDTVLDPYGGLFTTGVACNMINRKFIGIELMENYYNMGIERMRNNANLFRKEQNA